MAARVDLVVAIGQAVHTAVYTAAASVAVGAIDQAKVAIAEAVVDQVARVDLVVAEVATDSSTIPRFTE